MATKRHKNGTAKRSVSAPLSLWEATEKVLASQMPPVPLSRHIQGLIVRDLQERGLLANGKASAA